MTTTNSDTQAHIAGSNSTEGLDTFRARVSTWLSGLYPVRDRTLDDDRGDIISRTPDGHDALVAAAVKLQNQLYEAGLAGITVDTEYGGQGLTPAHNAILDEELLAFDTPSLRPLSIGMHLAMGTLLAAGSSEQRRRYLPSLVKAEEKWCQMFSEPDAGSDLVSLRTKAVADGDDWVINGQKVWSSYAGDANFAMLLARTDLEAERPHNAITMFILPVDAPGVTVRTLVDIAGGHHFNEVFLEDVRLSGDCVIGEINKGWQVANGTLGGERSGYMGGSGGGRRDRQIRAAAASSGKLNDSVARQRMASVYSEERILEWIRDSFVEGSLCGGNPVAGSMLKMLAGTLEQKASELVYELTGMASQAWDTTDRDGDIPSHSLNATRQARIAGGTHEIQRNLLGERVLGLPREPR